ncbi:MAG: DNA-binding response regulator [Clostridiaceae bacterium]
MISAIRKLEDDLEVSAKEENISMAINQIDLMHRDDDGFITIAVKKENNFVQYHYKTNSLKNNIGKALSIENVNLYVTPNSFYKPFRRIENIRKLNTLYIDLDYYNTEKYKYYTFGEIKAILDQKYFNKKVPNPSFIINTGRGIAIYWLIEPVPHMGLPLWNAIQKHLLDNLKDIGGDAKSIDSARIMRLAGSQNSKNGNIAKIHVYDEEYIYTLREIQENYLPVLTPYVKNPVHGKKGRRSKIVKLFTLYSLHYNRLLDLVKLQEMRQGYCRDNQGNLVLESQRELMCFLYRYWSCCFLKDKDKALEDTLAFNEGFTSKLSKNEVIKATISAEIAFDNWMQNEFNKPQEKQLELDCLGNNVNKSQLNVAQSKQPNITVNSKQIKSRNIDYKFSGYNYKNPTLIDLLNITKDEMKNFKLKTIIDKEEVKRRDYEKRKLKRRNEQGLTFREQEKDKKIKAIKRLKDSGFSNSEIALKLNISLRSVCYYNKELKQTQKVQ